MRSFYYRLVADIGNTGKQAVSMIPLATHSLTGRNQSGFVWVIHANVVYSVGILISYIFIAVFLCIPVSTYWTPGAIGYCLDEGVATLICGIITCVADLLTTVTPLPLVLKVSVPSGYENNILIASSFDYHAGSASRSAFCSASV